ncbi:MAG TPA: EAL domain-containing protein [Candidatus Cybelea sp.]|nr:EAL domain-containing protein [Candidatus Cybelea sp.]
MRETHPSLDALRLERDRFLAFAFAVADALIEIDGEGRIAFAAGATRALLSLAPEDLATRKVLDLLPQAGRAALSKALSDAATLGRIGPIPLKFESSNHILHVSGATLPERPGSVFLTLRAQDNANDETDPAAMRHERRPMLLDRDGFGALAQEAMRTSGRRSVPYRMSLIELKGAEQLSQRLQQKVSEELHAEIVGMLRSNSLGGDAAAQFNTEKYGLLHEPSIDIGVLSRDIEVLTRGKDPKGEGARVASATMDVSSAVGEESDSTQALLYAINTFASDRGELTLGDISQGSRPLLIDAVKRIAAFRRIIATSHFDVAFQPVVDLKTRAVHHYEALARFPGEESPFESIVFAENVGLIADFDLAMIHKVLAQVAKAKLGRNPVHVGINVSGRSLLTPSFLGALHKLLRSYHMLAGYVMFEITESAEIHNLDTARAAIMSLRNAGYPVCLDDFGAGATAFHYLHALTVDYVKIDGAYVRDALTVPHHLPFLKAMVQLCRDLKVASIGEMVETEETARFIAGLGLQYGQGYLFGKPEFGLPEHMHATARATR